MFTGHTGKTHISQTHHHPLPFDFVTSWTSEHCWILCFPRSDRSAPPRAVPRAVRAVRLDKDSVRGPCHSGMSDFEALMASYLMTDNLTYPQVSPPTPNNKFTVKATHTCSDTQVRWLKPAQENSSVTKRSHTTCNPPRKTMIFTWITVMHFKLHFGVSEFVSAWVLFFQP